ncbi:MAG: IclR family transcriptional regulator [Clostridia bacterium]|nr:IclR family transcriptional regulator [Clostridia bacterium]
MSNLENTQITSLERGLDILGAFSRERPSLTAAEIAEVTGLSKSTLYRFLHVLARRGYISKRGTVYMPGLKLVELGDIAGANLEVKAIAKPVMVEIVNRTGMTSNLSAYYDGDIVYIENIVPRHVRVVSMHGGRAPAYCTSTGKMLLTGQPAEELERIIQRGLRRITANTITDPEKLREEIEAIRRRGYSIDDQELEEGLRSVAGPIYNAQGVMVAAMSLAGPVTRLRDDSIPEVSQIITEACMEISRELGYNSSK